MAAAPAIELRGIRRTFDEAQLTGIRNVSLTIHRGDFVAIVGPSGAGKSTLINVLGLIDRADAGTYLLNGVDVGQLAERQRDRLRSETLGFVFQSSFVLGDQSVLENAALGLRIQGLSMSDRSEGAWAALGQVNMHSRWFTEAKNLSGGERQRLALARAIATRPGVVLADEPTGNLDTENGRLVIEHLKELNRQGVTIVMITHDLGIAAHASRQVHVIDGQLTEPGGVGSSSAVRFLTKEYRSTRVAGGLRATIADDLSDAVHSLSRRVLRTILLMFAFTLGISGLLGAIGLSESASAQVTQRLTQAALDEVKIDLPGGGDLLAGNRATLLEWISELRSLPHVVDVGYVAAVSASSAQIRRTGSLESVPDEEYYLVSSSSAYLDLMGGHTLGQAPLELLDNGSITGAAWAGADVMKGLELAAPGPGSTLWVGGRRVDLVGTFEAGSRAPQLSRMIDVTPDVLAVLPGVGVKLILRTEPGFPAAVAEAAPLVLDAANPGRFGVETVADLRNLRFGVANDLGTFVGVLSGILLFLAAVSASTTMYLSVQSRAHEIALRRAIGSTRYGVARLFVAEGLLIGAMGGIVGALIGTLAAALGAYSQSWTPVLPSGMTFLAVGLGILTGLLSSLVPAWAASRREPAEALRN